MLWHKAWLETRWRFLIGLALLMASAGASVLLYPQVARLLPLARVDLGGELGRRVAESAALARTYRGYIWSQLFEQNISRAWMIFAVLLGSGGLVAQAAGRGALYTLSLPVSRERLVAVRAGTALAELAVLAVVPCLLVPLLSPSIGERYLLSDAFVHAVVLFVAGSVFFSIAFLLSTMFSEIWMPPLLALCAAFLVSAIGQFVRPLAPYMPCQVMAATTWFRDGALPWPGLILNAAISAAMLYGASINTARRDF